MHGFDQVRGGEAAAAGHRAGHNASLLYPDFFSGFSLPSFSSEDTSKIAHHQPAPLNQPESPVVDIEFTNISVIIEEMKKG